MGYRLEVTDGVNGFYGYKHYGYVSDSQDYDTGDTLKHLKSYQYLQSIGKLDGDEIWDYGCSNRMVLTAEEFRIFMEYYIEEVGATMIEASLSALINSSRDKTLEWW